MMLKIVLYADLAAKTGPSPQAGKTSREEDEPYCKQSRNKWMMMNKSREKYLLSKLKC